jgi:hypothetical protein
MARVWPIYARFAVDSNCPGCCSAQMLSNHRALADSHAQTRPQIGHAERVKAVAAPRHSSLHAFDPRDGYES